MNIKKGFTLIELIIVIAILGALAAVILVALNPVEQLAKARDSGRLSSITSLGRAMEAYAAAHNSSYVIYTATSYTWITALKDAGEVSIVPTNKTFTGQVACTADLGSENYFCYRATDGATGTGPIIVYTTAESKSAKSKCAATEVAWFAYKSSEGRAGTVCTAASPANPGLDSVFKD